MFSLAAAKIATVPTGTSPHENGQRYLSSF